MKRKTDWSTLRKVLNAVGQYKKELAFSLLLALVYSVLSLCVPLLTGQAIDTIIGKGNVDFASLARILLGIICCGLFAGLAQYFMTQLNAKITARTVRSLRLRIFERLMVMPLKTLDGMPAGGILSRMMTDADRLADGLLLGFSQLFTGIVTILGTLFFMFRVNASIALVVVVITPLSLLVASFIARKTHQMFKERANETARQSVLVDEMMTGRQIIDACSDTENAFNRFDESSESLRKATLRAVFYSSITNPSTRFVNAVVYAAVCLSGALFAAKGGLSIGDLSCFLSYAGQYTKPFNEISGVIAELQSALVSAKRVFELIEEPSESPEPDRLLPPASGKIDMQNVSFSYEPSTPLIERMSLSVRPGMHIAIVGPTGCGKTTLINLLMRFYDPGEGQILVDDTPVCSVSRASLRENIGMVLQDTWLRSGTIGENIAFGKPDATREEIIQAARAAHADSFIRRLPQGYDTQIGEEGGSLSQGQKQLLCIARVMLLLPPILILDEATSSIDTRTEMKIQSAFLRLMQGKTSFIVAHRLSTVRSADLILVMKNGQIIQQGTHEKLMQTGGFYADLYHAQTDRIRAK